MKICIPIPQRNEGGMYTFLGLLRSYLDGVGIEHCQDIDKPADILFINSWVVPFHLVFRMKKKFPELRVVQRIDGSARDYGRYDNSDQKQARVNLLADLTIFQSRYAKYATTRKYKVIRRDGPIIYNPVDTEVFTPDGEKENLAGDIKIAYVSYSTNPKKGFGVFSEIVRGNPNLQFYLIGRCENNLSLPNLHNLGLRDRKGLSCALRSCDFLLFLAENESCPNVVLEGLSSGLPVLYLDSGATPELVGDAGMAVNTENFRQIISLALERRQEFSKKARQRTLRNFSPDIIFPRYLESIFLCQRRPFPKVADHIRLFYNLQMNIAGKKYDA